MVFEYKVCNWIDHINWAMCLKKNENVWSDELTAYVDSYVGHVFSVWYSLILSVRNYYTDTNVFSQQHRTSIIKK